MQLSLDYIWEKLMASVSSIAEVDAPIKKRLANAYAGQLRRLHEEGDSRLELPDRLATELRSVLSRLREGYRPTDRIGDFEFDEDEASELIGTLVSVYDGVCRLMEPLE